MENKKTVVIMGLVLCCSFLFAAGCKLSTPIQEIPHEQRWGIYTLDLATETVRLIYSSPVEISVLRLNHAGNQFAFSMKTGAEQTTEEIFVIEIDGQNLRQVTDNNERDLFPAWGPDDTRIAFLTFRNNDLDIYAIDIDGKNEGMVFDSGYHDADIDWNQNTIVFTSNHRIWQMKSDGTGVKQITEPPRAGEWENANLPYGDYDPHLNPDNSKVVFERMVDATTTHGNYDIFTINPDGTGETRLTNSGHSQGLPIWSQSGDMIVYIVAAIEGEGHFDIYLMNADGSNNRNVTPDYFPPEFLCHSAVISHNDRQVYFIGEWFE